MAINKLKDVKKKLHPVVVAYGKPGAGKTWFALNEPVGKTLYIQCIEDGGLNEIPESENIDVFTFEGTNYLLEITKLLNTEAENYDTIVIDPFNEFYEQEIKNTMARNKVSTMRIQDWGDMLSTMRNVIRNIVQHNDKCNIVFLSHTMMKDVHAPNGSVSTQITVPMQEKVSTFLYAMATDVIYLEMEKGKFYGYFVNPYAYTKSRKKIKQQKIENITLEGVIGGDYNE